MQTGQISLELVIVIIVVAAAASSLAFLAQQTADSQNELLLQNQAKEIVLSVSANLKGLMQVQESASGTRFSFSTPSIRALNPTYTEKCTISISRSEVTVNFDKDGSAGSLLPETLATHSTVFPDSFSVSSPVSCGEQVQATKQ